MSAPPHKNTGRYIVIEGQDGTGKSTQVELLAKYLRDKGQEVITVREPGGGNLSSTKIMRDLLKNKDYDLAHITKALVFAADRSELWNKVIEPALKRGATVISDRNWWSTIAYEHFGFGVAREKIEQIHAASLPRRYLSPDVGLIFTLDDKARRARLGERSGASSTNDTFESQPDTFQTRVNRGYETIARDYDLTVIDASPAIEEIAQKIRELIY